MQATVEDIRARVHRRQMTRQNRTPLVHFPAPHFPADRQQYSVGRTKRIAVPAGQLTTDPADFGRPTAPVAAHEYKSWWYSHPLGPADVSRLRSDGIMSSPQFLADGLDQQRIVLVDSSGTPALRNNT